MANNAAGFAALEAQIARLRRVATLPRDAAPACAEALQDELEAQITRAQGPDGRAWAPRQEDGGKPLQTAAKALTVVATGTKITARLRGHIARHHKGRAKGGIERQILPTRDLNAPMVRAVKRVLVERFNQAMEV